MASSVGPTPPALPEDYQPIFKRLKKKANSARFSSDYSDLKITSGGWHWDVHRIIVCPSSEFFRSCCKHFKEASTGIIDLPEDEKHAVDAMLTYVYTADYSDRSYGLAADSILFNVRVHTIADKYGMLDLCKLAEAKFAKLAVTEWKTAGFAKAIQELYTIAPDSKHHLRKVAVKVVIEHAKELFKDNKSDFAEMSRTIAPFAHEISTQLMSKTGHKRENEVRYECPECKESFVRLKFTPGTERYRAICPYCTGFVKMSLFKVIDVC